MPIALLCRSYPPMVSGIAVAVRHMAEAHSLETTLAAHERVSSDLMAGPRLDSPPPALSPTR